MPGAGGLPQRLADAIQTYVAMRGSDQPVSLRRVTMATRFIMPELEITEKELSDMIANRLISLGCNISFDLNERGMPVPGKKPARRAKELIERSSTDRSSETPTTG